MAKSVALTVGVRRRVLWIGNEAYPLQNIARVQTLRVVPDRGAMIGRFLRGVIIWLLLGVAAAVGVTVSEVRDQEPRVVDWIVAAVGVLVTLSALRLVIGLSRPTTWALVIETAGSPHAVLQTRAQQVVDRLVRQIMDAIADPDAAFQQTVNVLYDHSTHNSGNQTFNGPNYGSNIANNPTIGSNNRRS